MTYICANQPVQSPISDMRLAMLVALADYWAENDQQAPITAVTWQCGDDGRLQIGEVTELAKGDEAFIVKRSTGFLLRPWEAHLMIRLAPNTPSGAEHLGAAEKHLLDIVMARAADMSTAELQRLTQKMRSFPAVTQ